MSKITYSDVEKRQKSLSLKDVEGVSEASKLYFERLEEKDNVLNARQFINECAKDSTVASYYMEDIQHYTDKYYTDPTIKSIFENQIIPMISLQKGDTVLEGHGWEDSFTKNQICDRILDNMQLIESKIPVDALTRKRRLAPNTIADLCCEAVSSFKKLDIVAKVNIALENTMMLVQKYYREDEYISEKVIGRVLDLMMFSEDATLEDLEKINLSLVDSPIIEEYIPSMADTFKEYPKAKYKYDAFVRGSCFNLYEQLIDLCLESSKGITPVIWIAEMTARSSDNTLVDMVFGELKSIPDRFMDKFVDIPKGIKLYKTLNGSLNHEIKELETYIPAMNEAGSAYTEKYKELYSVLKEVEEGVNGLADFIYPEYNLKMIREGVFSKAKGVISLVKASEKLSGIVNNLLKARKWIKGKAQPMSIGKEMIDTIKTAGSKPKLLTSIAKKWLLKEDASIYEYITADGEFDAIIDRYFTVDGSSIDSSVLNMFDGICREMNDNIFHTHSTGCGSYFLVTENMVEIRYFDNERVELTKEEADIVAEHTMDIENDMPLIYELALYSSMPDNICHLTEEELIRCASDTLLLYKEATENDFNTFLELTSQAGIWHETVQDIFESVCEGMPATFRTQYTYAVESYKPTILEDELALEALDFLKDFVTEKVDYDEKYGNLDDDDEEDEDESEEEDDTDEEDEDEDPKKEAKKKINLDKKDKDDKDDDGEEKKEKVMSFNNIKLFQMGLKKKMKDLSSKEQGFCRNLDSSFTRLVKSMQQALVSDRREAIIKGSVIPSLSKSIKWGCVIAGTSIINPIAPVVTAIGAFAMSKKLTKKERTLLLDDIEIELKVIDKEISMAESDNNTKKMRALMKEQRNLQRQYQRIKYNIRVGKDLIPGGAGGGND